MFLVQDERPDIILCLSNGERARALLLLPYFRQNENSHDLGECAEPPIRQRGEWSPPPKLAFLVHAHSKRYLKSSIPMRVSECRSSYALSIRRVLRPFSCAKPSSVAPDQGAFTENKRNGFPPTANVRTVRCNAARRYEPRMPRTVDPPSYRSYRMNDGG